MSRDPRQQLVRYRVGKRTFEVITKTGTVAKFRAGKLGFDKVLVADAVFTNSAKGDIAADKDLRAAFKTTDVMKCCQLIVESGDVQVSAKERAAILEEKRRAIVQYEDPTTHRPHPTLRIDACMKESRVPVDPRADTKRQAEAAVRKMAGKLVFTKAVALSGTLFLKHAYVGTCTNLIQQNCTVVKEDWTKRSDGCIFTLEFARSELDTLISALQKPTAGDFDFSMEDDALAKREPEESSKRKKGKKKRKAKAKAQVVAASASESSTAASSEPSGSRKKKRKKKKRDD